MEFPIEEESESASFEDQLPKEKDLIRKQEILQTTSANFVDHFIQNLAQKPDIISLKKLLNFKSDERLEVRLLIARQLRDRLSWDDTQQVLLARSTLKEYTNDRDPVIRLFAIETLRKFGKKQ